MKKVLAVVFAIALMGTFAINATAQTPNVQVYFDANASQAATDCPPGPGPNLTKWLVVGNNLAAQISGIEYRVVFPAIAGYLGETFKTDPIGNFPLTIGNSAGGVAVSWAIPVNAFVPLVISTMDVLWLCDGCTGNENTPVVVVGNPQSGQLRAIEYITLRQIPMIGMTSIICGTPVSTEETTWGGVKALYNN
jgi:hypothetical protein